MKMLGLHNPQPPQDG